MPSGSAALSARRSASGSSAARAEKLTTCASAWTPASVRAATGSGARTPARGERVLERRLHGGQPGLALEAAEAAAVVGRGARA